MLLFVDFNAGELHHPSSTEDSYFHKDDLCARKRSIELLINNDHLVEILTNKI